MAMAAEKHFKHLGELPTVAPSTSPDPIPRRRFKVARDAFAVVAFIWLILYSHYKLFNEEVYGGALLGEHSQGIYNAGGHFLTGKKVEDLFLSIPDAASAVAASRLYATKPHMAGSPGDFATAMDFLGMLQSNLGINSPAKEPVYAAGSVESRNATLSIPLLTLPTAWIDTYYPVLNTPLDRALEVLDENGNSVWKASLEEIPDEADPEAAKYFDAVPAFHGLSKGGEVEGQLVYANYGRKEDYDDLEASGVDLTGKIVIVRYGSIFRGLKVKRAQELGAVGVLIYSDLRDDGTVTEENGYVAYPHGAARNPNSVERGSVQFLSMYPGDPTTPGYPSYENSTRTDGENIPSIPSLPISWATARALMDEVAKSSGNRTVKLVNHVDTKVTPIWNTMGVIPGHIRNEVVVLGNHRDAWVMGAGDPSSGTVAVLEVIRGFGVLVKHGWKPLRTIVIASWDAEEYGLMGSTEWGEDFEDFIRNHVVAYVNIDTASSGSRYSAEASPSLSHLLRDTAEDLAHPTDLGRTLWDARLDRGKLFGKNFDNETLKMFAEEDMEKMTAGNGFGVGALGSGSDYTVFLQHIGIASLQIGFRSTLSDPVYHYHSVFDSERWQELYGDPGFSRHVAAAKHLGLQTLRLADSIILPINTTHYALDLEAYLRKVENISGFSSEDLAVDFLPLRRSIEALKAASMDLDKEKTKAEHELKGLLKKLKRKHSIHKKLKKAWCRLKKAFGKKCHGHKDKQREYDINEPLRLERGGKIIELKPRIGRLLGLAKEQEERENEKEGQGKTHVCQRKPSRMFLRAVKRVQAVNKKLSTFERGFISEGGIKDREWYRHLGVAPGKWLGYGATTFPAITEAITIDHNVTLVRYETARLKALIDGIVDGLRD